MPPNDAGALFKSESIFVVFASTESLLQVLLRKQL